MQRIRFQSLTAVLVCYRHELTRTPVIHCYGKRKHQQRPERIVNRDWAEEDAAYGLIGDPEAGGEHEKCFYKGGNVLNIAVAVRMDFICRLVRDAHRKKRESCAGKVDS